MKQLKEGTLKLAVEDPDAEENWPRVFLIWRGNALSSSAKGQEYFLRHYLGTDDASIAKETAKDSVEEVVWRDQAPKGKLDLVVDLNFRMDTSALYSDLVLPAATWYEKDDLNTTDLHTFIHPLQAAVPPCWESKSDWDAFEALARKVTELSRRHLPDPVKDLVTVPIQHDTPGEMARARAARLAQGRVRGGAGQDHAGARARRARLRPPARSLHVLRAGGARERHRRARPLLAHRRRRGTSWPRAARLAPGAGRPTPPSQPRCEAANLILRLAPETNGEMAARAFHAEEKKVGLPLADLAEKTRGVRMSFDDLGRQPRRLLNSPCWTGIIDAGRTYTAYALNVERLVPWRTVTGRQHLYLDHPGYLAHGEALPTYKPRCDPSFVQDLVETKLDGRTLRLNYLTPHGKWNIHSTYGDNLRMLTLSRGLHPLWVSEQDAATLGLADNDWVEVVNDHGVVVTRAVVSARVPAGMAIQYHAPERTISVPRAPARGGQRGGSHNSLSRVRLKPTLMMGGYGQFSYGFNYWGPTGNNRDTYVLVRKLEGEPRY